MKYVIAIDIGGTKTIGALFDENSKIHKEIRIPTDSRLGPSQLIEKLKETIRQLLEYNDVSCISIGSAGRINVEVGSVFYASDNIPGWTNTEIKKIIEQEFKIHTIVENDCKVAGLGEEWQGSARGLDSYVCLVLGTGVGASVKVRGNLIHGSHWSAGELGHMTLYPNGRQCNCGLKGCLEQYCSGPSLVKRFNENRLDRIATGYDFFERVRNKDFDANKILDDFIDDLHTSVISLFNIYDPEKIIIGGGLVDTKDLWWDRFIALVEKSPINSLFKPVVEIATLGNKAGIYGAAYLGFQYINEFKID